MKKLLGVRVNILLVFLLLSLVAISPKLDTSGVEIKSLDEFSASQGLQIGEVIKEFNGVTVNTGEEFKKLLNNNQVEPVRINIVTDKANINYFVTDSLRFELDNLTIVDSEIIGVEDGEVLKEIDGNKILNEDDFEDVRYDLLPSETVKIKTDKKDYVFETHSILEINVKEVSRTNLKKGLDLDGGTRVLLKPVSEDVITDSDVNNLISVMRNRLNVYGLSDLKIRQAQSGEDKLVLIEIAGVPKEEVEGFISKQGKFEAKIGDGVVFRGGKDNIPIVCKDDGTCSGVRSWNQGSENEAQCRFEFSIKLSKESAQKHAEVTEKLDVIVTPEGGRVLSEQIEFYLDDNLIDSLNIGEGLKGSETTDILISGPGVGRDQAEALEDALDGMEKLQVVLITGSLPFDLEIVKLDSISPIFGETFVKNAFVSGLVAI